NMPAAEIGCRLREFVRQREERRLYVHGRSKRAFPVPALQDPADSRAAVAGTGQWELRELTSSRPEVRAELEAQSDLTSRAILSGRWTMLGHGFNLTKDVDWHCEPRTGHRFPRGFYADVPLHQDVDDGVDVKYVWELGRQQYLVELARGWLFSGDERCAFHARRLMLSWIEQNPLYEGVHWTSGLEAAVRAISWIWTLATLAEWDGWRDDELDRIAASLVDHAIYLEHHFSFYSSPYNHLVGEATGLYLISQVLRQLPEAARWRNKARQVLEEHGPRQFDRDGFCVEQAMGYHYFTLGFLAMAIVAARNEGDALPGVERAAHQAFRTGILFQQPDGRWPAIGDVDSARSIPVYHDDFWDFSSLCSLGAVLFHDPQLKRPGMEPGEELFWLLGTDGIDRWNKLEATSADGFTQLPESGYVVARQGGDWLCFDAGPIAHGLHADATPSTAHGHLDTLQVLSCHNGQPVLVDPGMPFYFGDREWVRHFRSAAAHNTIEIEGILFAKDAGRLAWSHASVPTRLEGAVTGGLWLAHGRFNGEDGVIVERSLLAWPGEGLWIADRIHSLRPRRVCWHWQLPAVTPASLAAIGKTGWRMTANAVDLIAIANGASLACELREAAPQSPAGWQSEGYGVRTPGASVMIRQDEVTETLLLTAFTGDPRDVEVAVGGRRARHARPRGGASARGGESIEVSHLDGYVTWRIQTENTVADDVSGGRNDRMPADRALSPSAGRVS
ncbi:MAG: alginate lyase family protein, partial [Planctomycetaceae bacterium]